MKNESKSHTSLDLTQLEQTTKKINREQLAPLAKIYGFRLCREWEANGMPNVLMLGNHSSGKSSFINYLFGKTIQKTGVAPTDDGFTIIRPTDQETDLDGPTSVTHPEFPYRDLEQFGPNFLAHLKIKLRCSAELKNLVLIDSPGMIDAAAGRDRGYDFVAVVRHFAEAADLVVFFFDPDKPGTTGESLQVFMDSLSGIGNKLLIVMNKVDLLSDFPDFARAYGALCWNLAHVIKTKDMPHIFCTFIEKDTSFDPEHNGLPLADFKRSREEVIAEIYRAPERRADNLVTSLYDSTRRLQAHSRVVSIIGEQYRMRTVTTWVTWLLLLILTLVALRFKNTHPAWLYAACGGGFLSLLGLWLVPKLLKSRYAKTISHIDDLFWSAYHVERTDRNDPADLTELWNSVKPSLLQYLERTNPFRIPSRIWHQRKFKQLKKLIDIDIPGLRRGLIGNT